MNKLVNFEIDTNKFTSLTLDGEFSLLNTLNLDSSSLNGKFNSLKITENALMPSLNNIYINNQSLKVFDVNPSVVTMLQVLSIENNNIDDFTNIFSDLNSYTHLLELKMRGNSLYAMSKLSVIEKLALLENVDIYFYKDLDNQFASTSPLLTDIYYGETLPDIQTKNMFIYGNSFSTSTPYVVTSDNLFFIQEEKYEAGYISYINSIYLEFNNETVQSLYTFGVSLFNVYDTYPLIKSTGKLNLISFGETNYSVSNALKKNHTLTVNELYIYNDKELYINGGGFEGEGANGIYATTSVTLDGEFIFVSGGSGDDGKSYDINSTGSYDGGDGKSGGIGIQCSTLNVLCNNLEVNSGNGGSGGQAASGSNGGTTTNASSSIVLRKVMMLMMEEKVEMVDLMLLVSMLII